MHILAGFHNLQELSGATPRGRHSPITLARLHLRRRRTGWSCRRNAVSTTERRINRMTRVSSMKGNQSNFLATLKPMRSLVSCRPPTVSRLAERVTNSPATIGHAAPTVRRRVGVIGVVAIPHPFTLPCRAYHRASVLGGNEPTSMVLPSKFNSNSAWSESGCRPSRSARPKSYECKRQTVRVLFFPSCKSQQGVLGQPFWLNAPTLSWKSRLVLV
jgi:hypothetical protein